MMIHELFGEISDVQRLYCEQRAENVGAQSELAKHAQREEKKNQSSISLTNFKLAAQTPLIKVTKISRW